MNKRASLAHGALRYVPTKQALSLGMNGGAMRDLSERGQ